MTPSTGYQSGSGNISTPTALIIDNAGSIWITNSGNNTVTKIIGGAAPVVTPTITGTTNNTLGTRPMTQRKQEVSMQDKTLQLASGDIANSEGFSSRVAAATVALLDGCAHWLRLPTRLQHHRAGASAWDG